MLVFQIKDPYYLYCISLRPEKRWRLVRTWVCLQAISGQLKTVNSSSQTHCGYVLFPKQTTSVCPAIFPDSEGWGSVQMCWRVVERGGWADGEKLADSGSAMEFACGEGKGRRRENQDKPGCVCVLPDLPTWRSWWRFINLRRLGRNFWTAVCILYSFTQISW